MSIYIYKCVKITDKDTPLHLYLTLGILYL